MILCSSFPCLLDLRVNEFRKIHVLNEHGLWLVIT